VLGVIIIVHVLGIGFRILGGQNLWPIISYHQGVFVLAGPAAISGLRQPATRVTRVGFPRSGVDHRFNRDGHPLLETQALTMLTIVRYHWVFVHCRLDSVTDELADVTVAIFVFRVVLDDR